MRRYRLCVMAIKIGPDRSLASRVKPSGAQPTAAPAIGGRSPASRHAEERRAREASAARRDAEDRARDTVAKAADDVEDLGDFGDVVAGCGAPFNPRVPAEVSAQIERIVADLLAWH